jgi:hypothetical protein
MAENDAMFDEGSCADLRRYSAIFIEWENASAAFGIAVDELMVERPTSTDALWLQSIQHVKSRALETARVRLDIARVRLDIVVAESDIRRLANRSRVCPSNWR